MQECGHERVLTKGSHVHEVQKQAKLIYCDESQKSYLGRFLPARGDEGTFWAAREILYLDLGGDYAGVHTGENSLICTLKMCALFYVYVIFLF